MHFYVESFSARTATTARADSWMQWSRTGVLPPDETPPVCAVPPLLRRRLTPLGRLALGALAELTPKPNEPMIFASSWGDIARSFSLMETLARDNEISPTHFSASVHNGIGAVASIWQGNTTAYKAICAEEFTTESALLEAWLVLGAGHESVVLVRYEDVMPEAWYHDGLTDTPTSAFAWAVRLTREQPPRSLCHFSLTASQSSCYAVRAPSRYHLEDLAFLLSDAPEFVHSDDQRAWIWRK